MPNSHSCDYMIIKSLLPKLKLSSSLSPPFDPGWCQPGSFLSPQPLNSSSTTLTLLWQIPARGQLSLTLSNPLGSLTSSSVHRIFQARALEWVVISSSRESSRPRDWTLLSCVSCLGRWVLYPLSHRGSALTMSISICNIFHYSWGHPRDAEGQAT